LITGDTLVPVEIGAGICDARAAEDDDDVSDDNCFIKNQLINSIMQNKNNEID
jgi:hypothetical protein